ncbi:hypothetical protein NPIL_185191 [Nephila pilipes]|uniref:Uncharacterized protein n=1 Tax=Nephila pilipes TaxID=299642 RepID=A0A8X6Q5A5_NEPPI|nr:hypothetical protein NPIL_185191 [Nephila pilipes]
MLVVSLAYPTHTQEESDQMDTKKFCKLGELEDTVNYPNFFESDDDGTAIDIVELPTDKVYIVLDVENYKIAVPVVFPVD